MEIKFLGNSIDLSCVRKLFPNGLFNRVVFCLSAFDYYKRQLGFVILALSFSNGFTQVIQPASWKFLTSKDSAEINDTVELVFQVELDREWHLYSVYQEYDFASGPKATEINFDLNSSYQLLDKVVAIGFRKEFDSVFNVNVNYFQDSAEFRQKVKILKSNPIINGTIEYQVCTMVDGKCINLEEDFEFQIQTKDY